MMSLPLFEKFPSLESALPRISLGSFPTPIERSAALSKALGCELYVKRDDLSGLPYGGNKVRKLEFIFGDLQARGKTAAITVGGLGSHHVLATALYGKKIGMQIGASLFPQPLTEHAQDTLSLTLGSGTVVDAVPLMAMLPISLVKVFAKLRASGHKVGVVPPGGSSALGTIGYVNAALELAKQIEQGLLPMPDLIVAPLGSNGTIAGLGLGLRLAGIPATLWGVRVVDRIAANSVLTMRLASSVIALMKKHGASDPRLSVPWDTRIIHEQFGKGYAYPTEAALRAKEEAKDAGILVETTYTAKTLAALFAYKIAIAGRRVLFWNTFSSANLANEPRKSPSEFLGSRLDALRVS
jgi:1-aminocyclopropane-1-carboxylate deaminase/D-cysteine desulfhydrase-like pyridoxal-dependent ACC family enzyme